jgi:hypothetical protein
MSRGGEGREEDGRGEERRGGEGKKGWGEKGRGGEKRGGGVYITYSPLRLHIGFHGVGLPPLGGNLWS